jgi:hypothetical protein
MKRSLKIFELSANEQRVVLIVMLILVVIALIRYERRVHQAPVEPVGTSAHSPSPNPPSPEE